MDIEVVKMGMSFLRAGSLNDDEAIDFEELETSGCIEIGVRYFWMRDGGYAEGVWIVPSFEVLSWAQISQ